MYLAHPPDPRAVVAAPGVNGVHGDGLHDDADALQAAINRAQEAGGEGIVFLAGGRYRLSHTVELWSGIRLIGYGRQRPVLLLADHAPGFDTGHDFLGTGRYLLQFASRRPLPGSPVVDANEFTFFSGVSNIDFDLGHGNRAAIAIRFHVAQHSFIAHSNIEVNDARAGLEDVGNQAHDITVHGGDYGIVSVRTSPAWQFLLMDAKIAGQRLAAIHTEEAGMTLVRVELADTPVAVEISRGKPEQLYGRDLLLQHITRAAVVLGDVTQQHHQVTLENVLCSGVNRLLEGGEAAAGWTPIAAPSRLFVEQKLILGQAIEQDGREGLIELRHREEKLHAAPALPGSDVPPLPPVSAWVSVKELGAQGDGETDDTAALQQAVDAHRVLYFPSGLYRLSRTLHLRAESVLIGLNPATTLLTLKDRDPAFMGEAEPVPLLDTPEGGSEIVTGMAIATGSIAPRAAGIVWRGGRGSLIDDVNFPRGNGRPMVRATPGKVPSAEEIAQAARAAASYRGSQFPSLWIRDGGGGTLRDIWTANTMARAGWRIEGTHTGGVAYQVSCEHHPKNEVQMVNAAHWTVYALQTEEENPDGVDATAIELDHASDITFANLFDYRVSRTNAPKLAAIVSRSSGPVRLENMHNFSQTRLAFDNSVVDETSGVMVRTHDFTSFQIDGDLHPGAPLPLPPAFHSDAKLQKLADGFSNATGLSSGPEGSVFFTDSLNHRVYRWSPQLARAVVLNESMEAPQSATFVAPSSLLVVDNSKRVFALPAELPGQAHLLAPQERMAESTLLLPVGLHEDIATLERLVAGAGFFYAPFSNMARTGFNQHEARTLYYAPGSETAMEGAGVPSLLPAPRGVQRDVGTWKPDLQAMQFAPFRVGQSHLAVSEDDDKVYRVRLASADQIQTEVVAARSGTSVVQDEAGNMYVAGAQLVVYNKAGRLSGVLEIPERPSSLAFGGADHSTLFIGARSGLYSIRTASPGSAP